jgi:DNA-binding ferritin-like protein
MKFRDIISEKVSDDYVLQTLADKDINAKIEDGKVIVDKSDVQSAQKVLKAIGCTKKVQGGLNESLTEAIAEVNDNGIGYIIPYTLQFIAQAHTWHLLCPNGQKHMALGELYEELQSEVDELAEKFIAQGGTLLNVNMPLMAYYDEFTVRTAINELRNIVTSAIDTNPRMASIVDGLTDLQEVIDAKLYKFNLT